MKKIVLFFIVLFIFCLFGCEKQDDENKNDENKNEILNDVLDKINIDEKIRADISLSKSLQYNDVNYNLDWTIEKVSGEERAAIDNNGHVVLPLDEDASFILHVKTNLTDGTEVEKSFPVTLLSYRTICEEAALKLDIPSSTNEDIVLPLVVDGINIEWYSSNEDILSKKGKCTYVTSAKNVKLSAALSIDYDEDKTYYCDIDFDVQVTMYSFEKRVSLAKENINLTDEMVYGNLVLPKTLDYDLTITWVSGAKDVISDDGVVLDSSEERKVNFEGTIVDSFDENNVSKITIEITVGACIDNSEELDFFYHNIIDYTSKYTSSHLNNLEFNSDGKVVLKEGATSGTYESRVFHTRKFKSLVGSWSCITSPNATIELEISVYTGGKWSKYYTYGVWGLGKTNTYYNQTDSATNTKMSVDEIMINNGDATACKYKVTLRRDSTSTASPVLSLVCLALEINESNYSYPVDISSLPKSVDNDLPKLYQYDVPTIGGSICSATTTTMLLKWKGYSFTDKGKAYEHEYIAGLVADPGHNSPTYGNWSYNMAVAGAYGDNAYVARMYSWEEVMYHLATVGPMGASIKSPNGEWGYSTNGHLVIIRGYRISDSGSVTVICNDPAVRGVYYEVTLSQFLKCWRGVSYVMEK